MNFNILKTVSIGQNRRHPVNLTAEAMTIRGSQTLQANLNFLNSSICQKKINCLANDKCRIFVQNLYLISLKLCCSFYLDK